MDSKDLMDAFAAKPVLGHISTFGGHLLSCAAGRAALKVLPEEGLPQLVEEKGKLFHEYLVHPNFKSARSAGLLIAVEFDNFETNKCVIDACISTGLLTDWFLFARNCLRITPALTVSHNEILEICRIIKSNL